MSIMNNQQGLEASLKRFQITLQHMTDTQEEFYKHLQEQEPDAELGVADTYAEVEAGK